VVAYSQDQMCPKAEKIAGLNTHSGTLQVYMEGGRGGGVCLCILTIARSLARGNQHGKPPIGFIFKSQNTCMHAIHNVGPIYVYSDTMTGQAFKLNEGKLLVLHIQVHVYVPGSKLHPQW